MIDAPQARCAKHPDATVSFTCPRCGAFGCVDCERRPTLDAAPLCPACWKLAAPRPAADGTLQTAGLVVGVASILPCCPLAMASLVINVIALVKATKEHRWKPLVGLAITVLVSVLQVLFFALYGIFSTPR
jgi:predicted RNA-binding Zn-ribbon protein involved in translation (DUF1610 family)